MANSFLTTQEIARRALPALLDNLVFPRLIHQDYSDAFAAKRGDTIRIRKPVLYEAKDFDAENGVELQDVREECVDVTLDRIATVDISVSALDGALNFDDAERLFLRPAAEALAEKINAEGMKLYRDVYLTAGTAGTTPASLSCFAAARSLLNQQKAPQSGRCAVWNPAADAAFAELPAILNAEKSGTTAALREGSLGRVFGIDNYMSSAVMNHETGITAAEGVTVSSAVAAGAETLNLKGTALTGQLVKGDLLEIGGKSYTVTQDTAAASSNSITGVHVSPALEHCASGTAVTLVGNHAANLVFHPAAFAFVTRPLSSPAGVDAYVTSYNGLSLRVVRGYDMMNKRDMLSMDVLYSFRCVYPELALRYLG